MRRNITAACLIMSTVLTIWMVIDPEVPLHHMMSHYDGADVLGQVTVAVSAICLSFGIGKMFPK